MNRTGKFLFILILILAVSLCVTSAAAEGEIEIIDSIDISGDEGAETAPDPGSFTVIASDSSSAAEEGNGTAPETGAQTQAQGQPSRSILSRNLIWGLVILAFLPVLLIIDSKKNGSGKGKRGRKEKEREEEEYADDDF